MKIISAPLSDAYGYVAGNLGLPHEETLRYAFRRDFISEKIQGLRAQLDRAPEFVSKRFLDKIKRHEVWRAEIVDGLCLGNINLLYHMVHQYHSNHQFIDQHEFFSEGQVTLWKCGEQWNPEYGSRFGTYIECALLNNFSNLVRDARRLRRDSSSDVSLFDSNQTYCDGDSFTYLDQIADTSQRLPFEEIIARRRFDLLDSALASLSFDQRSLIECYYLSDNSRDMTDEQLRQELDVSVGRAAFQARRKKALRALREFYETHL
ncbi:MAG: sigma-70 family RNA polymerase sigma factor [Nanoarchaeota archaeon]